MIEVIMLWPASPARDMAPFRCGTGWAKLPAHRAWSAAVYIAMNRFKVLPGEQDAFRTRWLERDVYLKTVAGFVSFHLLKGPTRDDHVLYASHTVWASYRHFEDWTRSEQFRAAHAGAGSGRATTLSHPEFEGFEVLQEINADPPR